MDFVLAWTWKKHDDGERRGGMKAHAFEISTRRSLCRKYDEGPEWKEVPGSRDEDRCSTCRKEVARVADRVAPRSTQWQDE